MSKTATMVQEPEEEEEEEAIPMEREDEEDDEPLIVPARKNRQVAAKTTKTKAVAPPKPSSKKTKAPEEEQPEVEEEEQQQPKKKAAKKAKASKKTVPPEPEEEEQAPQVPEKDKEEADDAAAAPEPAAVEKKKREKRAPRAHGQRFATAPSYHTQLAKDRARRREEQIKAGGVGKAIRRHKPGELTKLEGAFLQKSNGLQIKSAIVRRMMRRSLNKWIPIIQEQCNMQIALLEARGKTVPNYLRVPDADKWSMSAESVELARGCAEVKCNEISELSTLIATNNKRMTVQKNDLAFGAQLMNRFGQ